MIVLMAATPEIRIVNDPSALAETAAQEVLEVARAAVAARGRFTVALAGGSTPRETYPRLPPPPPAPRVPRDPTLPLFRGEPGLAPGNPGFQQRHGPPA